MFNKLLVPLDGSAMAEAILPHATDLARVHQAELVLLLVTMTHGFAGADLAEAMERAFRAGNEYLQTIEKRVKGEGLRASSVVRSGEPAQEILNHAELEGVDLIAMSTHGRTGIRRWVLGSVAEKVLRASAIPVLLIRSSKPAESPA